MFRRWKHAGLRNTIWIVASLGSLLLCTNVFLLWNLRAPSRPAHSLKVHDHSPDTRRSHPIDTLMKDAQTVFDALVSGQTTDVHAAAEAYRAKRGRHPPPGFDAWVEYAQKNDAVIAEELFDQIHRDLNPFWWVSAKSMRDFARHFQDRIIVRNGSATMTDNNYLGTANDRMEAWRDVVKSFEHLLPDMDIAMNVMDESRIIVPGEDIDKYVEVEGRTRKLPLPDQVISQYSSLDALDVSEEPPQVDWIGPGGEPYWDIARVGCSLQSPDRYKAATTNLTGPPPLANGYPLQSYHGSRTGPTLGTHASNPTFKNPTEHSSNPSQYRQPTPLSPSSANRSCQ
jgi:hypothetical protein